MKLPFMNDFLYFPKHYYSELKIYDVDLIKGRQYLREQIVFVIKSAIDWVKVYNLSGCHKWFLFDIKKPNVRVHSSKTHWAVYVIVQSVLELHTFYAVSKESTHFT